jgi:hypothetical protein
MDMFCVFLSQLTPEQIWSAKLPDDVHLTAPPDSLLPDNFFGVEADLICHENGVEIPKSKKKTNTKKQKTQIKYVFV